MATGDHDWTAGEQVTAANMDDYLMLQALQQFATNAARDTALSARKRENMVTAQADTNCLTVYSGAAWSTIGPVHGALTAWTPVITQGATPTFTNNRSVYQRVGRWVWGSFVMTITGTPGTAANNVLVTLPVTAVTQPNLVHGMVKIADVSAGFEYQGLLVYNTATNCLLQKYNDGGGAVYFGTTSFTAALASGDVVTGNFAYEAAADA